MATQPAWQPPPSSEAPRLKVWNSLTRSKVEFAPRNGRRVSWYNCGPTVYDLSHLGHARNYVSQDILRRILEQYFGYEIHLVMNITDIDDKIIVRARENHLLGQFRSQHPTLSPELVALVEEAFALRFEKTLGPLVAPLSASDWPEIARRANEDAEWLAAGKAKTEKFSLYLSSLGSARSALDTARSQLAASSSSPSPSTALIDGAESVIAPWLDARLGSSVPDDPALFRSVPTEMERLFFADMRALRVRPPTTLTRVSEYVPEVVAYVERIIARGYGYAAPDGSVYFDTAAFDGAAETDGQWTHSYAKLAPWSKGNKALIDEGEGSLSLAGSGKRSASDFALWKASKPGEPAWPSPWGPGRPGWHIECSVMASAVLGERLDIHSGGSDLAFPHHDNELAQAEAYHGCRQWVDYFLHTGHLHIEGLKMSKSLKNFITIQDALRSHTARQLRLAFLLQLWSAKMDFRESSLQEVLAIEAAFDNFFSVVRALLSESEGAVPGYEPPSVDARHHHDQPERDVLDRLARAQDAFHAALCDSFNTPAAMTALSDLVSSTNSYIARGRAVIRLAPIEAVARWVGRQLRMFGLGEGAATEETIGWGSAASATNGAAADTETLLMPYLRSLSTFRDGVRSLARANAPASDILALCDRLRDDEMVGLGVALDDQDDGRALVKLVPRDVLVRAREDKLAAAADKQARKQAQADELERKRREKLERGKLAPSELFRPPHDDRGWSAWDDEGVPTKDAEGADLSKAKRKALQKEHAVQVKLHEAYRASLQ